MTIVNMLDAKTRLSRLVELVEQGAEREIIIARNGKPAARLVAVSAATRRPRRLGLLEGVYPETTQEDLDRDNDEIGRLFRGES
jgi:prevent-host-death family protein